MTIQSVLDLITQAARKLNVIQQGQTLSGSEAADLFLILNGVVDQINSNRPDLFAVAEQAFALTSTKQDYLIGPGAADFNQPRPVRIQNASCLVGALRRPVNLLDAVAWGGITDRSSNGNIVENVYYDYGYPIAGLHVNPIPIGAMSIVATIWTVLAQFSTLADPVNLPPAYWDMLVYRTAIRAASEYGAQITPELAGLSSEATAHVEAFNAANLTPAMKQELLPAVGLPQAPPQQGQPTQGQ